MRDKLFFILVILLLTFSGLLFAQEQPTTPAKSVVTTAGPQNKISLDIKGMDIVDVLKMLATRAGINIVVGKNVSGRVTLFLKDVNVWDAFEILILANDLAYEKKGEIINVMTQRDYELLYGERYQDKKEAKVIPLKYAKAADLSRALNQIKTNIGKVVVDEGSNTLVLIDTPAKLKEMEDFIKNTDLPIQTRVFSLNYAQADKLQPKIQETLTKGVGYLKIDERSNKIVVTDYPAKLDEIANAISAFDEKTPQVLIDAQIIEIKPSDKFYLGVDWDYFLKKNVRLIGHLPTGSGLDILKIGEVAEDANASADTRGEYKGVIDILRTIGDTKILSSPRIIALNNQESKILVGTKEAYIKEEVITPSTGSTQTIKEPEFVEVGIKLFVTPTINRDGFVTMKIRPEVSSHEYKDFGTTASPYKVPIVTTSQAETSVMVKDGVTIIIGGLQKEQRSKSVSKIPILGDIPALGHLFRKTSDELTKTELVILLTPHIMSGEKTYSDFSEIKPVDGAVAKMEKGNIIIEKTSNIPQKASSKDTTSDYYKLVTDKIKALALFERPKTERGEIKLAFTLSRDGNLMGEPNILETNNTTLSKFIIKMIKNACPFPPFPEYLKKDKETFKISLSYE